MSGGSRNYEFFRVEEEYCGRMLDPEMDAMMEDLVHVLEAVEWYESGDTCEESYRNKVAAFKAKWFNNDNRIQMMGELVAKELDKVKQDVRLMVGLDGDGT